MTTFNNRKDNKLLRSAIVMLERKARKEKLAIWKVAAQALSSGTATWPEVNVGHLARLGDSPIVLVPGKVLGSGSVENKKIVVGAFSFSASAREKILAAGGKALSLEDFVKKYPDGSGVSLVK